MAVTGFGNNANDFLIRPPGITSSTPIMGKSANEMGMDDFMRLLVAQMSNQDMLNPTSDTEFIAQMAQFASLQGIQQLQESQLAAYAVSYVGKYVSIAHLQDNGGLMRIDGQVERVTFFDGQPMVVVNGISFPLFSVMEVLLRLPSEDADGDEDGDDDGDEEGAKPDETDYL